MEARSRAQVDEFGVDPGLLDGFAAVAHHREIADHGDIVALPKNRGLTGRNAAIEVVNGHLARLAVEIDMLDDQDRILQSECRVHESHVVGRRGGGHDAPARTGREDACRIHEVL